MVKINKALIRREHFKVMFISENVVKSSVNIERVPTNCILNILIYKGLRILSVNTYTL